MSTYRYMTTDIITGQVLFDNLPILCQSVASQISGIGQCSGALQLRTNLSASIRTDMIQAMQPFKSVLWVFQDNQPIWAGPIVGWSPTTMVGAQLPFTAASMETMFQYRLITESIDFVNEDLGFVFRELGLFAISKVPGGTISGLNLNIPLFGNSITQAFEGSYMQSVYDAWNTLVTNYNIEFTIRPRYIDNSNPALGLEFQLLVGDPLGRPYSATHLSFTYPSKQVLDYEYTWQTNSLANAVIATGTDNSTNANVYTSDYPNGYDLNEIKSLGYPLLEGSVTLPQPVTSGQGQVDEFAVNWVTTTSVQNQITPTIYLGPGAYPRISDVMLGDQCVFAATSPIHPAPVTGGPGLALLARITGWSVYPASQGNPEQITYNLGAVQELFS